MNLKTIVIFSVLSTFLFPNFSSGQGVVINEIGASNSSIIFDEDGSSSDWIELYNWSDFPVDLSGFGLSNKKVNQINGYFHRFQFLQKAI